MPAPPLSHGLPGGETAQPASPPARGEGRDTRHCPPGGRDDSRADLPGEGSPGSPASPGGAGLPGGGGSLAPPSPAGGGGASVYFQNRGRAGKSPSPGPGTAAARPAGPEAPHLHLGAPPAAGGPGRRGRAGAQNEGCLAGEDVGRSKMAVRQPAAAESCFLCRRCALQTQSPRGLAYRGPSFCPYLAGAVCSERSPDDLGTLRDEMDLARQKFIPVEASLTISITKASYLPRSVDLISPFGLRS